MSFPRASQHSERKRNATSIILITSSRAKRLAKKLLSNIPRRALPTARSRAGILSSLIAFFAGGLAQGVAAKPGPAADLVVDTLATRAAKQPTRLAADLNENLGPAMSPVELETSMTARRKAAGRCV